MPKTWSRRLIKYSTGIELPVQSECITCNKNAFQNGVNSSVGIVAGTIVAGGHTAMTGFGGFNVFSYGDAALVATSGEVAGVAFSKATSAVLEDDEQDNTWILKRYTFKPEHS